MAEKNDSLAGNFESTAQRMLEVFNKASSELSRTVDMCSEQLTEYNLRLQKSLADRLAQIKEQFLVAAEGYQSEMESRKDKLSEQLEEFERAQVDTLVAAARGVRESLDAHAQQIEQKISRLVEQELVALKAALEAPGEQIPQIAGSASEQFREIAGTGKCRIEQTETKNEEDLTSRAQKLENELGELVVAWKDELYAKVEMHQSTFKATVENTTATLAKLAEENLATLKESFEEGARSIAGAVNSNQAESASTFAQWKQEMKEIHDAFSSALARQTDDFNKVNNSRLEYKTSEATGEINGICREAREKVQVSASLLSNSLARLEQDYRRRLDAVIAKLESTISETSRRTGLTSSIQQRASDELKEKLKANLSDQGQEILRLVSKVTEQLEQEYVRASRSLDDRVDTIRASAVESLEKQVHSMKLDLDKINRSFQHELSDLSMQADELEEAGKAAAVFVMAYRSSILSLDSE